MKQYLFTATTLLLSALLSPLSHANTIDVVQKYLPQAQQMGAARLNILWMNIYDIALYAPQGQYQPQAPHALQITYFITPSAAAIAKRTLSEMRKQGFNDEAAMENWYNQMLAIFPDIEKGDTLMGIRDSNGHSQFYLNNSYRGTIADPQFSTQFFAIWLSPQTSQPNMRRKLLTPAE